MLVEKESGIPFQNVSVSRTHARQWVETRRYDPTLTIQTPPPESTQRPPSRVTGVFGLSPGADGIRRPAASNWLPSGLGRADAYWPPNGPNWPPFILTPPAETNWPPYGPNLRRGEQLRVARRVVTIAAAALLTTLFIAGVQASQWSPFWDAIAERPDAKVTDGVNHSGEETRRIELSSGVEFLLTRRGDKITSAGIDKSGH